MRLRERALAPLGRIEPQERTVLLERVEQGQQRRDGVLEGLVKRQQLPGHLGADPRVVALVDTGIAPEQVEHGEVGVAA